MHDDTYRPRTRSRPRLRVVLYVAEPAEAARILEAAELDPVDPYPDASRADLYALASALLAVAHSDRPE